MTEYSMFINGEWVDSSHGERIPSVNPYNQEIWATIPQASAQDILSIRQVKNLTD